MEQGGAKSSTRKAQSDRVRNLLFGGQIICDWHGVPLLFVAFKNRLHDTRNFRPVKHDHLFCSKIQTVSGISGSFSGSAGNQPSTLQDRSGVWEKSIVNRLRNTASVRWRSPRDHRRAHNSASALIEGTERSGRKVESEMSTERPCTEPIRWGITAGLHCAGISVCSIPN